MYQQISSSWLKSDCNLQEMMQNHSTSMGVDRGANGSGTSGPGLTATHVSNISFEDQFLTGFEWNQPANQSYYSPEQSITLENNYLLAPYSPSEYEINDFATQTADDVYKIINQLSAHSTKIKVEPSTVNETESPGSFVRLEEVSATLANHTSLDADGTQQVERGQPGQVVKTKSARKSSLSQRAVKESPINDMIYLNSNGHEVVPGKQEMSAVSESTKKNLKRRVLSSTSAANVSSKVVSKSKFIDHPQELLQTSTNDAPTKKPKMHQNLDDPRCRNAYLAHVNRERKRKEEETLRSESEKLKTENETLKRDNELLTNELLQHRRLNKSFVGLQRLFPSVSNMMETIMKSLEENNGGWKLVTPPWFDQVPSSSHIDLDENHTSLSTSIDNTSNYITLHMNPTDRIVQMDYTPLTPNVMVKQVPDAV